jgi:hypothetical protein
MVSVLKVTDPVPAWTVSSKEIEMAVLGGIHLVPEAGNVLVTVAGVPVVRCRGPVLSVELDPLAVAWVFNVYTNPAVASPGKSELRELPAASINALRSMVNL